MFVYLYFLHFWVSNIRVSVTQACCSASRSRLRFLRWGITGGASLLPPSVPSYSESWQCGTKRKVTHTVIQQTLLLCLSMCLFYILIIIIIPYYTLNENDLLFSAETITALFKTRFRLDCPFDLQELPAFAILGWVLFFLDWRHAKPSPRTEAVWRLSYWGDVSSFWSLPPHSLSCWESEGWWTGHEIDFLLCWLHVETVSKIIMCHIWSVWCQNIWIEKTIN